MKTKVWLIVLVLMTLFSCDFRKSVRKDFITGLSTAGDGLSCDNVYLTDGVDKINRTTFTYGEKFYLNFENAEGFEKQEGYAFPGMSMKVVNQAGDTLFRVEDLYAGQTGGIGLSPLLLRTSLTVADPIRSNGKYTLLVNIWDKKEKGTFRARMDFDVVPSPHIRVEPQNVTCKEVYLFDPVQGLTITGNTVKYNQDIYLIFEGLEGFTEEAGEISVEMGMKITDAEGALILEEKDLTGGHGMEASSFRKQITPNFILKGSGLKNPVTCEITLRDRKGEGILRASADLNAE